MRNLFRLLMILGVLAGLSLRASGMGACHQLVPLACPADGSEEVVCCEESHYDEPSAVPLTPDDSGSHDGEHHHHHHICCGMPSLAVDEQQPCRLPRPACLLLGLQWPDLGAPESPVFDLDKPPLI